MLRVRQLINISPPPPPPPVLSHFTSVRQRHVRRGRSTALPAGTIERVGGPSSPPGGDAAIAGVGGASRLRRRPAQLRSQLFRRPTTPRIAHRGSVESDDRCFRPRTRRRRGARHQRRRAGFEKRAILRRLGGGAVTAGGADRCRGALQ